jgi:DNA end-binding protein Ku
VRAIWKGHLRLSLVTIPIRVFPATNAAATIHFHQLHRTCQTRIQYKKWCPHHHVEADNDEIVKGYEFERGRYVVIEDKEIDKVRPESTRVVNLSQIVDAGAIDSIFFEEPYFLSPDGKPAAESFAVLRDALQGRAAIGTVAFHGRERLVAIEPRDGGLSMFTLRRKNEIRSIDAIDELEHVPRRAKTEEVSLAKKVMASFERKAIDFSKYPDTYEEALKKMIERKIAGEEIVEPAERKTTPKVVNLMDALRKSLDEAGTRRKRPARATMARGRRPARVTKLAARKRA